MTRRRAVIVGAGGWARVWGRTVAYSNEALLAGWVDLRPGIAEEAATGLGLADVITGTDLRTVLEQTRPDFVVNATVPAAHCEVSVQALAAGLPVLCEKPMAASMEEARRMIEASERSGKLLMISQQRTHDPKLIAMRELISKRIGPLGILNSDFFLSHPEPGYHPGMPSALIFDMAVHTFDAARFLSVADPVSVYCEDFNPAWSWHTSSAAAVALFEMEGGLRYSYRGCWASPGRPTTWEAEWRAVGAHGTAVWDGEGVPEADVVAVAGPGAGTGERIPARLDPNLPTGPAASLTAFLNALDSGTPPVGECHDNVKTLAMVLGAMESAATGQRVDIRRMLS
jgi:predicted dehydrogenase